MNRELLKTTFVVKTKIGISMITGGGWNAKESSETKAVAGDVVTFETLISPPLQTQDNSGKLFFPKLGETHTVSFETLGELIACGNIEQVKS